jgi:hypothetical protein
VLPHEPGDSVELPPRDPIVLNPGSVGQSRDEDPRARFAILDTEARVAAFHAVAYDVAACRRALAERGLPPGSCHVPRSRPSVIRRALSRGRRLLRPT